MKPITVALLREHGACESQVVLFQRLFGGFVLPTRDLVVAHMSDFDFAWAKRLLNKRQRKAFEKVVASAFKAYEEAAALAEKAYEEAEGALALAEKAFDEAVASSCKVYEEVVALAFFESWSSQ